MRRKLHNVSHPALIPIAESPRRSRHGPIPNPIVRIGFHLLRGRERRAFLDSTRERMRTFTELALERKGTDRQVRDAAAQLTARPNRATDPAHDAVAQNIRNIR